MTHLWTPWRSKYIREHRATTGCIFCDAVNGTEDSARLVVFRNPRSFIILNRFPYTTGHVMIAPNVHVSRLSQVDEETTDEIMRSARKMEGILEHVYHPDGINLGMNLGEAAGAGIEQHIHMHVLPRWKGDSNFMGTVAQTRILPEMLDDTYSKLREALSK